MGIHTDLGGHVIVDGKFTSAKAQHVAAALQEYDDEIHLEWLEKKAGDASELPQYRVTHRPNGQEPFVLFYVKDDSEMDARIVQRVMVNDQRNGKVTLSELEAWEAAQKAIENQKWLDEMEAVADIAYHVLKTPLNDYKVSPELRIKEGIPYNAANLDEANAKKRGAPAFDLKEFMK